MLCPEIIATIGIPFDQETMTKRIEGSLNQGISSFRFNLSKCRTVDELDRMGHLLTDIFAKQELEGCKLMLDVPFPGRKTRIAFKNDQFTTIFNAEQLVTVTGNKQDAGTADKELIYVDNADICKHVFIGQELIYSDGDCKLIVEEIDEKAQRITARVSNTTQMYTNKSISYNYIVNEVIDPIYIDFINKISPASVAFSFVNDLDSLMNCISKIADKRIEWISKIETANSMMNANEIAGASSLMFGRGDFILNSAPSKIFEYQTEISNISRKNNAKLYIATGILSSLKLQPIPTPSEMVDLYSIMACRPDAIVLNAELIAGDNVESAVKLIRDTASLIHS